MLSRSCGRSSSTTEKMPAGSSRSTPCCSHTDRRRRSSVAGIFTASLSSSRPQLAADRRRGVGRRARLCPSASRAQLGRTGRAWGRGAARAHPPSSGGRAWPRDGDGARLESSPWSWKYSKTTACTGVTATDRVRSASSTSIVTKPRVCFQLSVRMACGGRGQRRSFGGSRWTRLYNLGAGGEGLQSPPDRWQLHWRPDEQPVGFQFPPLCQQHPTATPPCPHETCPRLDPRTSECDLTCGCQ